MPSSNEWLFIQIYVKQKSYVIRSVTYTHALTQKLHTHAHTYAHIHTHIYNVTLKALQCLKISTTKSNEK